MNYWKVILATIVIFGAGVLTGGFLVNDINHPHRAFHHPPSGAHQQANHEQDQHPPEVPMPRAAERMSKQFLADLDDKLKLTHKQHDKIKEIIADGQERNHEIWTNAAPKMRAVMQDVHQKIREQLSDKQKKEFEDLIRQFHSQRPSQNKTTPKKSKK